MRKRVSNVFFNFIFKALDLGRQGFVVSASRGGDKMCLRTRFGELATQGAEDNFGRWNIPIPRDIAIV